ncbi:RNA polymerase sigma factor, sigma-70 family [Anaerococcus hydrogenalis DSM 7454]|uniref:RNA polymerase sigma factor, sigma-70 family n=1 Tax=Anaerococcus hydrogenalis DSM 7454 TaxID=561177 RepID=B6W8R0_9FIRM|nr:sigma-70 family RNA polymerase sigma factor [Anaerococcus hydrogenalis]EEB36182.1 RNA polymerase sigma factor, sigma-70 family [Anaerococcus hydrogenalis DSM 7454]
MKICLENLDAIIGKYEPLLLSMSGRFPVFDRNEAYIMARDMVFEIVRDFDPDKGKFGGYLKYRLYFYFLNECKKERVDSLNDLDKNGIELIEKIDDEKSIEDDFFKDLEIEELFKAINTLKKQEREILYLKYDKNLPHKEIARLLNLSTKSITNYHYNIVRKLRKYFIDNDLF